MLPYLVSSVIFNIAFHAVKKSEIYIAEIKMFYMIIMFRRNTYDNDLTLNTC